MTSSPPDAAAPRRLDLRGTPCPLNYVRSRLMLETLPSGGHLELWLDSGEPEAGVREGLCRDGHRVTPRSLPQGEAGVGLLVVRDAGDS